ncbi:hypothetical protein J5N97_008596 [Dioscorea zingiberensis]|uniref:RBR-type E3 ubiquitin transferase n=1 Tax=Dioscorea zingiberensis TaxID=325984 RepID=A0A9D5HL63_9LILI|nr:hypothetical protein J5N97_008596 [Dioscorea zingiberensis]
MDDDENYPQWSDEEDDDHFSENVFDTADYENLDTTSYAYTVVTEMSLLTMQMEQLNIMKEILALPENSARILLINHRWDVRRILELFERKGKERLFSEAGVTLHENNGPSLSSQSTITCNVCFEDFSMDEVSMMSCGHYYCNNCWTEHFIIKINDGESRRIRCMTPNCNAICNEEVVRKLLKSKSPDIASRFDRFLLESYIEDNNKVKWCPSTPHCGNAIQVEDEIYCEVECSCGLQFCFNCLSKVHSPCSCKMWDLWSKKCQDDSENINWILVNTKPCPKCQKKVDKNGGCNLVKCICGQHFCWLCGAATGSAHTYHKIKGHSCGRYDDEKVKHIEHAKRSLHRYTHYYDRYKVHADSLKHENEFKVTFEELVRTSKSEESNHKSFRWALNGANQLLRARQVLSNSYPFAFYMFGDELFQDEMTPEERLQKQNLFEVQQQQLEFQVENLSMCLGKGFHGISDTELFDTSLHIINLTRIVNTLCKELYLCIEDDLLSPLQINHPIAPYKSQALTKNQ